MTDFRLSTLTLLTISAFGFYSILILTERNGWGDMLRASVEDGVLPNGKPLRKNYTGVTALDAGLTILVRVFYTVVSWERPSLSVFMGYLAGQLAPLHTALVLEGLRAGNKGTALYFPAIWGLANQFVSFGVTLPIYCVVQLWRSPLARPRQNAAARNAESFSLGSAEVSTVPGAMLLGYVIPTVLPVLPPSLISTHTRQGLIALWQVFPVCVSLSHRSFLLLGRVLGLIPRSSSTNWVTGIKSARKVYRQTLALSGAVHLAAIAFVVSPLLRETLLGSSAVPLDIKTVFRPMSVLSPNQVAELGEGLQTLLLYDMYCGFAAAFAWVSSLAYAAAASNVAAAMKTAGNFVLRSLLVGPGGAVLWALWDRDEEMLMPMKLAKKAV